MAAGISEAHERSQKNRTKPSLQTVEVAFAKLVPIPKRSAVVLQ